MGSPRRADEDVTGGRGLGHGSPTIRDVATEAKVSVTTVSHVFSGKRHVAQLTRERVLAASRTLGYVPSANAHGLATGRSMTFGLQVGYAGSELFLNPFFTSMLPAMSTAALARGYSFILLPPGLPDARSTLRRLLDEPRIDGMVLIDPDPSTQLHEELVERGKPFVTVGRIVDADDHVWVDNDHGEAAAAVLGHLAEQGYERPALLGVHAEQSFVVDFEEAYSDWCREAKVPPVVVWTDALTEREGYDAAARALAGPSRPDSLVCLHDRLAVGALRAVHDAGLVVPDDIGVVGSTDTLFAAYASPPVTSQQLFPEQLGENAVHLLLRMLDGEHVEPARVPMEVVVRESTLRANRPRRAR